MNNPGVGFVIIPMSVTRLLLTAILTTFATGETVTLTTPHRSQTSAQPAYSVMTITLEEGEIATALYVSNTAYIDVTLQSISIRLDGNDPNQDNLPVIAGPATIRLANYSNISPALSTFSIKRANTPQTTPSQVVVIPDDGQGDREVLLESSTDMVTWTPTQAGLFNSNNAARFFRVRIIPKPAE